jgi:hypothetical protein
MASALKPALVIVLKRLPVIVSLIEDNELTTPVAIDETVIELNDEPYTQMITGVVDLFGLLKAQYPREIELFTAIQGHCNKTLYLMTEGELRIFLIDKEAIAMKRISDTITAAGLTLQVREKVLDLIMNEDDGEYEWLPVGEDEEINPDLTDLYIPKPASWTPAGASYGLAPDRSSSPSTEVKPASPVDGASPTPDSGGSAGNVSGPTEFASNTWTPAGASFGTSTNVPVKPTTTSTGTTTSTVPSNWTPAGASFGLLHTAVTTKPPSQDLQTPTNWTPAGASFGATNVNPIVTPSTQTGPIKATFNGVVLEDEEEQQPDQGTVLPDPATWTPGSASFDQAVWWSLRWQK